MKTTLRRMWQGVDHRLVGCSLLPGLLYAIFTCVGCDMLNGTLENPWWKTLGLTALYTLGYTAASMGLMAFFSRRSARPPRQETLLGRITGNGFVVFLVLVACWIPTWLAFWPGTFAADSLTQFESYYNEQPSAHHPLLHTALLGWCMTLGIDLHPEGEATWGLAIYSGVQLTLLAACVAYGCWWLRRRGAPVWARLVITALFALFPFYSPWAFNAQKDVLFGALVLVFCLQLLDLWRFGMKPLRLAAFVVISVLMMLLRNNGVYALVLTLPFAFLGARNGKRIRTALLLLGCIALYLGVNNAAIALLEAERGSKVELLSVPLQQLGRTLCQHPDMVDMDTEGVLETLYEDPAVIPELYHPQISDPVRWALSYELLDENIPSLLKLWARVGAAYPREYAEAFLEQNLPYYLPLSPLLYHIEIAWIKQPEWFVIQESTFLPRLRELYETYDASLRFAGIPGTRLLSHPAFFIWLALFGFAHAIYTRRGGFLTAFAFLLAIWITCLLGPVAIMRYMLGLYYAVPVLLGAMLIPDAA